MSNTKSAVEAEEQDSDPSSAVRSFKSEFCLPDSGILDVWHDSDSGSLMVLVDSSRMADHRFLDALDQVPAPGVYRGQKTETTLFDRRTRA